MNPNKDSMLIDIQYIKANKRNNTPDYLYVIWRDLISNEKVPISDATESYVTLCGIGNNTSVNLAAGKTYRLILLGW